RLATPPAVPRAAGALCLDAGSVQSCPLPVSGLADDVDLLLGLVANLVGLHPDSCSCTTLASLQNFSLSSGGTATPSRRGGAGRDSGSGLSPSGPLEVVAGTR